MISRSICLFWVRQRPFFTLLLLLGLIGFLPESTCAGAAKEKSQPLIQRAARVFDGADLYTDFAVSIIGGKVASLGPSAEMRAKRARVIDLGDATLLPGFIELHGHQVFQNVPRDTVLCHGVITVRDVGGPLLSPSGGKAISVC